MLALRGAARAPERGRPRRRLAALPGRPRLHHRTERARAGPSAATTTPATAPRHLKKRPRRLDLPRHRGARDPHHDAGRRRRNVHRRHRDRPAASCPSPTRGSSRPGSSSSSCSSPSSSSSPSTASTCTPPGSPCRPSGSRSSGTRRCWSTVSIAVIVTMYAIFSSSLTTYLKDFVDVVIVWIAPWVAIFLVDWALRGYRYVPSELQDVEPTSLYWNSGGVFWPAIFAQLFGHDRRHLGPLGHVSPPQWLNEVTLPTTRAPTSASSSGWQSPASSTTSGAQGARATEGEATGAPARGGVALGVSLPWQATARVSSPSPRPTRRRRRGGTTAWRQGCGRAQHPRRGRAPGTALSHEGAHDDRLGIHAAHQAQRGRQRRAGGHDVVDHCHTAGPARRRPGPDPCGGAAACRW